jgi:hypothetical protein
MRLLQMTDWWLSVIFRIHYRHPLLLPVGGKS